MDGSKKAALLAAGIDVDSALERFLGNEALLERFLKKFLDDPNHARLTAAFAAGDREGALTASHTMKGVCGNLSMHVLFDLLTKQVQALRAEDWAGAEALLPAVDQAYDEAAAAIRRSVDG